MKIVNAIQAAAALAESTRDTEVEMIYAVALLNRWVVVRGVRRGFGYTYAVLCEGETPVKVCEIMGGTRNTDEQIVQIATDMKIR